jgi:hypothetical protein
MRGLSGLTMLALVLLAVDTAAQTAASFVYVESFRKGQTRVTEQTLQVDLDPHNPSCEIRVKDQSGRERYRFLCAPQRVGQGDDRILGWQVRLVDLQHKMYNNVLMPSPDVTQDKTQVGWLDPGRFAKIPLMSERVVKIDNFYCVVQVKDFHFVTQQQPYLDHMTVDVRFTNTLPHSEVRAKEDQTS